ncbi:hypothetical protein [Halopenitus persicus]|uniref:hypothetical protein n=1 Tax=Halopenitus persicus TaxID=1048396 RepID=UPI000BBA58A6|nr:hypothetical protein [Halopenitus persicus]
MTENLHDNDDANDNQQYCNIDAIESEALRDVARRWRDAGLELESGNTLGGDYVSHLHSRAKVYVTHGQYAVTAPDGEHRFDSARDAAQYAFGITEEVKRVTRYAYFPVEIQHLLDELAEEGFEIIYGDVESEGGGIAFAAERGETSIYVADWTHSWAMTCRGPDRPSYDNTWEHPSRVRGEVWGWLEEFGD